MELEEYQLHLLEEINVINRLLAKLSKATTLWYT